MQNNFGEATPDDVREACQDRNMQLWVISRNRLTIGAVTTMLVNYDRKRVVRVVTLGGKDFDQWVQQGLDYLKAWGIEAGCTDIEVCVRQGFERKLTQLGFQTGHVVMIASLGVADGK